MTVTYTAEVATCRGLGCFLKLLRRWKGSIYKLVWLDLIVFLMLYYSFNFMYRFLLDDQGKEIFENVVRYCKEYSNLIPLSFVLGFYVSVVMTRWWNQYTAIPFPDPLAVFVSATVHGQDERGRVMRRTIMRYVCLCVTMMFAMISPRVKKRFPTLDHFIEAGLLHQSEKHIIADMNKKFPNYSKHWLPIMWASSIVTRARKEGRIRDDFAVKTMLDELNKFRGQCGLLLSYDMISVPLVYTQVVTLAVYSYFFTTLMGQQWVEGNEYKFDLYFPVFTTLQFFFYVGWLKVAESLINPFGDDDDDFEINWMVDRNLQVSYLIVDEMHHEHPELVRDQYWDEVFPQQLPYTGSSTRESHPLPSTANIQVHPNVESDLIGPSSLKIDELSGDMMNSGGIMFSAKPGRGNSQTSMGMGNSVPDSRPISRAGSVTSMLKRFLSKEDKPKPEESQELTQVNVKNPTNSKKFATEVIEEVDEQTTITSQKSANENRPSVLGVFGPPPHSEPISVPNSLNTRTRTVYDPFPLSTSAPVTQDDYKDTTDNVSIGSSSSEKDEFSELKKKRDEERLSRLKVNLLRSVSTTPNEDGEECEVLLDKDSSKEPQSPSSPASVI
ncbi:bestrophin-2-like isoform X1 [Tribolium madens]|uniref:bestrophin-2-like isoform X1 n=2 Tax=Tribolium madens TaxID=41895 RepID=UPI001CF72116|nr:bestrophin-2-like isoform X1 [Tribolium madens]